MISGSGHNPISFGLNRIFYGWWIVFACFFISFYVGSIIFYGFTAFFEPLVKEFNWSYTQVSFASSLRGVEMSFLSPLVGYLVDRLGSRRMVFWGVITVALGLVLLSFTRSLWMFYASFILIGFGGGGCASVVLVKVVGNWFERDVGKAIGIMSSGFGASGLMLPVIVWLTDAYGWRMAMVILGTGMLIIGTPLAHLIRDTPEDCGLHPDGRRAQEPSTAKPGKEKDENQGLRFRDALKNKTFICLSLAEMIRMTSTSAVVIHIMPYLSLLHIPRATAGIIAGAISVMSIVGRFGFGWLADVFNKRIMIVAAYGLTSLGMLSLCFVETNWVLIVFLCLYSTGYGGAMVLRAAILQETFGRETFGRLFGLVLGAAAAGGVIGPTLAGLVFDTWKSYVFTWVGLSIGTALAAFLMLAVTPRKTKT